MMNKSFVPCTASDIQKSIEKNAEEVFVLRTVPELLFWDLGVEYFGKEVVFHEETKEEDL